MRTVTAAVEQQEAITRDNVPIKINAVIWRKHRSIPNAPLYEVVDVVANAVITSSLDIAAQCHRPAHARRCAEGAGNDFPGDRRQSIDKVTEPWGVKVERVQMKNVEIPESHAARHGAGSRGAARETRPPHQGGSRARCSRHCCARRPRRSCKVRPGLELRRMQMITEVGAEQNTMTIVMMPSEFVSMARRCSSPPITKDL